MHYKANLVELLEKLVEQRLYLNCVFRKKFHVLNILKNLNLVWINYHHDNALLHKVIIVQEFVQKQKKILLLNHRF